MTFRDLFGLSLGNIWRIKIRAILTIAGVVIAIAAFVALVSFGAGNQKYVTEQYQKFGLFTTIQVSPPRQAQGEDTVSVKPLDSETVKLLAEIPGVELVFPYEALETRVTLEDTTVMCKVRVLSEASLQSKYYEGVLGEQQFSSDTAREAIVTPRFLKMVNIEEADSILGRHLILEADASSLDSAIINVFWDKDSTLLNNLREIEFDSLFEADYRTRLMRRELSQGLARFTDGLMNRQIRYADTVTVVAVLDRTSAQRSSPILIQETTARKLMQGGLSIGSDPTALLSAMQRGTLFRAEEANESRSYPRVTLQIDPMVVHKPIVDSVEALGYRAVSLAETFKEIQRFFMYFNFGLGIIGLIALVTAALGIVNTMVMAIIERRREIGVLKSLGADERDLKLLFLIESGVIGAVGSAVGIVVGWTVTRIISMIAKAVMQNQELPEVELFALPLWLILVALAFGIVVSVIAGLYPASRAARVDPVEALRAE